MVLQMRMEMKTLIMEKMVFQMLLLKLEMKMVERTIYPLNERKEENRHEFTFYQCDELNIITHIISNNININYFLFFF